MNDENKANEPANSPEAGETSETSSTSSEAEAAGEEVRRVEVQIERAAEKDLKAVADKKHRRQLAEKIDALEHDPLPHDARPIVGGKYKAAGWNFYRVDVGEYRIVYDLDEQTNILTVVTVTVIGRRNDDAVYKLLERRYG